MARIPYRCRGCWKRVAMQMKIDQYKHTPKCPRCGCSTRWFVAKDMLSANRYKNQCRCDAYHYPHYRGQGLCRPGEMERRELEHRQDRLDVEKLMLISQGEME